MSGICFTLTNLKLKKIINNFSKSVDNTEIRRMEDPEDDNEESQS